MVNPEIEIQSHLHTRKKRLQASAFETNVHKEAQWQTETVGHPHNERQSNAGTLPIALEPVSETTADNYSFGFRKERGTADAMARCHTLLSKGYSPQWILEGDIKGCFDHISHDWLMKHIPMDKTILGKWLKCGYIFENEVFPTDEGTPQGGIISPTLANMALDGLQKLLEDNFPWEPKKGSSGWYCPKVRLVRFADDFIITGESKELLEQKVKPLVASFLAERGLTLSQEKTLITHIEDGFDFLGFNVRKFNGTLLTRPSKDRVKRMLDKVKQEIHRSRGTSQHELIMRLNPILKDGQTIINIVRPRKRSEKRTI